MHRTRDYSAEPEVLTIRGLTVRLAGLSLIHI